MATNIVATGVTATHDETRGLQNRLVTPTTGDIDDNDTALALPIGFATRMNEILAATAPVATQIGVPLSGYDGTNSGLSVFAVAQSPGGKIVNVNFGDADGNPLAGTPSSIYTTDGKRVYLYTDVNDNILLGKTAAGAIVFAAYIQETVVDGSITSGKVWLVQYEALRHPDTGNPDDVLSLDGLVYVNTQQDQVYDLSGAPSGQNLFMMFSTAKPPTYVDAAGVTRIDGVSIVATGKDPLNQSANPGVAISKGDTINSSQAGGPTTFGTNSQMITEQEGIRFSFVSGARLGVTIPNLDQNEADVENNIDFTSFFDARSATFDVVQLQSGKTAQVRITAYSTETAGETKTGFIDGYYDDALVNIVSVTVTDAAGKVVASAGDGQATFLSNGVTISLTGTGAFITGVTAGYQITYTTSGDHNRVLIENGAPLTATGDNHADFDIGAFQLLHVSTGQAQIGTQLRFEDDGPKIALGVAAATDTLTVDETVLGTNASASFADHFVATSSSYGTDGAGTTSSAYTLGVSAAGVDSGLDDTATGQNVLLYVEYGQVVGRAGAGGPIVFTVSVSAAGTVTLDQQRAVEHPITSNPDDAVSLASAGMVTLTRTDTIVDRDGDTARDSATIAIGTALTFKDDGPSIAVSTVAAADALLVDETNLALNDTAQFADNFARTSSYGADGAGTTTSTYTLGVSTAGVDSGLDDTATGQNVLLYVEGGKVVGRAGAGGPVVFTVSVDASGTVTLDQQRAVEHPITTNPDDAVSLASAGLVTLTRTDTIVDHDGDTASDSATIAIGTALTFKDDGPAASATPSVQLDDDALSGGNPGGIGDVTPDRSGTPGTLTGDFDNKASTPDTSVAFTLTAMADGQYVIDLATAFSSTTTYSTAGGSLPAGGPDAVQTLGIGSQSVVFTSVLPGPVAASQDTAATSTAADIFRIIGSGVADPTEAQLEAAVAAGTLPFVSADPAMNVSTNGIGVGNNLLQGYGTAAIGATDESLVVNPSMDSITSLKVSIASSQPYTPADGEALYYTIYYVDGTTSATTLVRAADLKTSASGTYFDVTAESGKTIDAVQLTMGLGDVKIPVVEFVQTTETLANDVALDFLATLTDADGDSVTDAFKVTLNSNNLAGSVFDYSLAGTTATDDTFDVDLASAKTKWKIQGFNAGDQIHLIGGAGATSTIDTSGADSIVTIREANGQTTTLTVVGVDLQPTDLAWGG